MEAVTEGHAQDDGADTHSHQGHTALEPVHTGHREDGSVQHGDHLLPQEGHSVETQNHDDHDQEERDANGPHQVSLDGSGIGNAALRITVYQDADVRVSGLDFLLEFVHHIHQTGAGTGVGGREGRGEEGQGHGLVRAEEMAAVNGDAAHTGILTQDFTHQGVPEVERIHRDQLGVVTGFVFHHNLVVPGHLLGKGLGLQGLLYLGVPGSINEGRKVRHGKIHGFQGRVDIQRHKHSLQIVGSAVPLFQNVAVFLCYGTQLFRTHRIERVAGRDLDKYFVNQADVAESELVGRGRAGKELDDVFLVLQFGAKPGKNSRRGN